MRKIIFLTLALLLGLGLCVTGAWADIIFNDATLVTPFNGLSATGGSPTDVIGDASRFNIYSAIWNGATLTFFTNWGPPNTNVLGATTADLFITSFGNTWAIHMNTGGAAMGTFTANVYANPTFNTTQFYFGATGYTYAGLYNGTNLIPALATSTPTSSTSLIWTQLGGDPNFSVAVNLASLFGSGFDPGSFSFVWAGATCGNDTISGAVPIPPTALLLGSGLLGLGLLGLRRRKKTISSS